MTDRLCARLGCDEPLTSRHANARYCSDACKSAAYKARTGYALHATRTPCQTRKSSGGPSGLQVSYRKAVEVVADFLTGPRLPREGAERVAACLLTQALSDKQRARLQARLIESSTGVSAGFTSARSTLNDSTGTSYRRARETPANPPTHGVICETQKRGRDA